MLIDNENKNKKVHEWLSDYAEDGTLDIVTGYFTVGALGFLSQITNDKIKKYRFVLGDIVSTQQLQSHTIDLLNENISIEASLKLKGIAIEAVKFLKQSKVEAKTLEPNFCHAKAYIFDTNKDNDKNFLMGSSNLTEAGIGLKHTNNIELNIAETGNNYEFQHILEWFNELWTKPQAHYKKTILDDNGKAKQVDFKKYLIEQIEKIFIEYSPKELYFKVLFELFGEELLKEQNDPKFKRDMVKLKNTVIYNTLYDFQKDGVRTLISTLDKYNGAILADAVGLGKTWSALAVMKHYQKSREVILLCPKKLQNNWTQYLKDANSKFENDELDYKVRFHTDLFENRLEKDHRTIKGYFQSDKDKLIVIDESHNLRNAKSNRYKFLIDTLIKQDHNLKVLLLSATPINNSLNDIKNQFSLLVKDDDHGFEDTLDIKSLSYTFRTAQNEFNKWIENDDKKISHFIQKLSPDFVKLTDSLIVSRTRKMIKNLDFPKKLQPRNEFEAPCNIGNFSTFEELMEKLPPKLTAYKPAYYLKENTTDDKTKDEKQRDQALVKMIYMLLYKRFESSWHSFYETIVRINSYHRSIYDKALLYKKSKDDFVITQDVDTTNSDEIFDDLVVGKREIKLSDIDANRKFDTFVSDLKEDLDAMKYLIKNLKHFALGVSMEITEDSKDTKLKKLIEIINDKKESKTKKMIIFTAYTDTADYIFNELQKRGVKKIALVHGGTKNYESILQRFAPYTKLYKEKQFNNFNGSSYGTWRKWIATNDADIQTLLDNPVDILIATDVLSEGQNLQDADMVVNYDIHWNPVRLIQRMGRIDRIGSPNKTIQGVNFWPTDDIKGYLDLQSIIENRMATMSIVGTEFDKNLTDKLKGMTEDKLLEQSQTDKMLKKLDVSWDDIEDSDNALGYSDLSLEQFRVDLFEEMQKKNDFYMNIPKGVFTGFIKDETAETSIELVALLKNRKNDELELIYIDKSGKTLAKNHKEALEFLAIYKNNTREVPPSIEKGNTTDIRELQEMLYTWIKSLSSNDGNAGTKTVDALNSLKIGKKEVIQKMKKNQTVEEEFDIDNYDLIVWFVVK